jgi:hypothetical protein
LASGLESTHETQTPLRLTATPHGLHPTLKGTITVRGTAPQVALATSAPVVKFGTAVTLTGTVSKKAGGETVWITPLARPVALPEPGGASWTVESGQQTGNKRLKSASLNHAESHHEKAGKPHE